MSKPLRHKYESVMQLPNAASTKALMNAIFLLCYQHYNCSYTWAKMHNFGGIIILSVN